MKYSQDGRRGRIQLFVQFYWQQSQVFGIPNECLIPSA